MMQTNTVQGPGSEAGMMRIKGTSRGLAMALDGNSRWCYLDPKLGASLAVAEAARKVACAGATPVAATNCLNFGNPEKPEFVAQLFRRSTAFLQLASPWEPPLPGAMFRCITRLGGRAFIPPRSSGSWAFSIRSAKRLVRTLRTPAMPFC
jgi:hypothetical protein